MAHFACMLDLETLGLGLNCSLISLSAQIADLEDRRGFTIEAEYNRHFRLEGQDNRVIDPATVIWWMSQGKDAQEEFLRKDRVPIHWGLKDFWTWYKVEAPKTIHNAIASVWSKGVDFDVAIIDSYYKGSSMDAPWNYKERMCYRTVSALFPQVPFTPPEVKHSAAGDCKAQLRHLWDIWSHITASGVTSHEQQPSLRTRLTFPSLNGNKGTTERDSGIEEGVTGTMESGRS